MEKMWLLIGGRKFLAYILGMMAIMSLSLWTISDLDSSEAIVSITTSAFTQIIILTGVYVGTNVAQKAVTKNEVK